MSSRIGLPRVRDFFCQERTETLVLQRFGAVTKPDDHIGKTGDFGQIKAVSAKQHYAPLGARLLAIPIGAAAVAAGLVIFLIGLALEMLQMMFGVNLGDGRDWA